MKSFPFCLWLATFGPCCSFPHRSWLSGSCQCSFGKSRGSKLPSPMDHHSLTMPCEAKLCRPPSAAMVNFPAATGVLAWEKRSNCSQLCHPSQSPSPLFSSPWHTQRHLPWGLLSHCGHQCSQERKRRQRDEGIRTASSCSTQVPRNEHCTGQKYQPSSTDALPSTHTSLVQTVTANPKIAELDKYREKGLQISERVTNGSAH